MKREEKKRAILKKIFIRNLFDKEKRNWTIQRYQTMKSEWYQTSRWSWVANLCIWITYLLMDVVWVSNNKKPNSKVRIYVYI
jgi:hypothetical protein